MSEKNQKARRERTKPSWQGGPRGRIVRVVKQHRLIPDTRANPVTPTRIGRRCDFCKKKRESTWWEDHPNSKLVKTPSAKQKDKNGEPVVEDIQSIPTGSGYVCKTPECPAVGVVRDKLTGFVKEAA